MNIILYSILLGGSELFGYLNIDLILPFINSISEEINAPSWWAYWSYESWVLSYSLYSLFLCSIGSAINRWINLFLGSIFFLSGNIMMACSHDAYILILSRVLQGASTSVILIVGFSSFHDSVTNKKAIKILSMLKACVIVPTALAPLIGKYSYLIGLDWRSLLIVNTIAGSISLFSMTYMLYNATPITKRNKKIDSLIFNVRHLFNKTLSSNIFTQNMYESCLYAWITIAPIKCEMFAVRHAIILFSSVIGMRMASRVISTNYHEKIIKVALAASCISMFILPALHFLGIYTCTWSDLMFPMSLYCCIYGLLSPIIDRCIAIALSDQNKEVAIGLTNFINYSVYASMIGIIIFFDLTTAPLISLYFAGVLLISNIINIFRVDLIKDQP